MSAVPAGPRLWRSRIADIRLAKARARN